jgi:hypothetical protein
MARKLKAGRRPKYPGEKLAKNRTFRVRGRLDDNLQAAARRSGKSVSEEIEYRLETSFFSERLMEGILGSDVGSEILRLIRVAMATEGISGCAWSEDPTSAENVRVAANAIISVLAKLPLEFPPPERQQEGLRLAKPLLLRSSVRRDLPPELMFSDLEPLEPPGERDSDDR